MRPWEREQDSPSPPDSPPTRPAKGSLSSLVVKPSADELARSGQDEDSLSSGSSPSPPDPPRRRLESRSPPHRPHSKRPPLDDSGFNLSVRSASLSPQQRTDDHYFDHPGHPHGRREIRSGTNTRGFRKYSPAYHHGRGRGNLRDISPPYGHADGGIFREHSAMYGRGRGRGRFGRRVEFSRGGRRGFQDLSPPAFQRGRDGLRDLPPNYEKRRSRERSRDISPLYAMDRADRRFRDISPIHDRERSGGRFRGVSPFYGERKFARIVDREFDDAELELLPYGDDVANPDSLDMPPRVGDWICRNPVCGSINFARREYCSNCNKFRHEPGEGGRSSSPRRPYAVAARSKDPPPTIRAMDTSFERKTNGYRSPPQGWSRDSPRRAPHRHDGGFSDIPPRRLPEDYKLDSGYRGRGKFHWLSPPREWGHRDHGEAELLRDRRVYDHGNGSWGQRERSQSPIRSLPPKDHRWGPRVRSRSPIRSLPLKDHSWGPRETSLSPHRSLPPKDHSWRPRERSLSPVRSLPPKDIRRNSFAGRGRGDRPVFGRRRGGRQ